MISDICEFAHEVYMKSIEELEKYLEDECYSFVEINIGKHHAHEGIVIEMVLCQDLVQVKIRFSSS